MKAKEGIDITDTRDKFTLLREKHETEKLVKECIRKFRVKKPKSKKMLVENQQKTSMQILSDMFVKSKNPEILEEIKKLDTNIRKIKTHKVFRKDTRNLLYNIKSLDRAHEKISATLADAAFEY
jgi:phosphomevalonate kinase